MTNDNKIYFAEDNIVSPATRIAIPDTAFKTYDSVSTLEDEKISEKHRKNPAIRDLLRKINPKKYPKKSNKQMPIENNTSITPRENSTYSHTSPLQEKNDLKILDENLLEQDNRKLSIKYTTKFWSQPSGFVYSGAIGAVAAGIGLAAGVIGLLTATSIMPSPEPELDISTTRAITIHDEAMNAVNLGNMKKNYVMATPQTIEKFMPQDKIPELTSKSHANKQLALNTDSYVPKKNFKLVFGKTAATISEPQISIQQNTNNSGLYKIQFDLASIKDAKDHGYNLVKLLVTKNSEIITSTIVKAGERISITADESLLKKLSGATLQVMAIDEQDGIGNVIASYTEKLSTYIIEKQNVNSRSRFTNQSIDTKLSISDNQLPSSGTSLLEQYLNTRINDNHTSHEQKSLGFNDGIFEAAKLYAQATANGMTHSSAISYVKENSTLAIINGKTAAYNAILTAQNMGYNVTLQRWNSRAYDSTKVSSDIKDLRSQGLTYGQIRDNISEKYKSNISESTIRKYVKE